MIIESERLVLRRLEPEDDAGFVLDLLNQPSFLRFIGDRGVRTLEDAREYIRTGPQASYERHGFGLWLVELKHGGAPAGICGLLKRDALEDVDIGFAFLPRFWSKGYAHESASAVLAHARSRLGLERVVAVVDPANRASIRLLEKLGFGLEGSVTLPGEAIELSLYGSRGPGPDGLEAEIQRSWTLNAAAWTEAVREERIESRRLATDRAVLEAVLERRPGRVLDVGCGEGWLAHRLAREGVEVVGFDASEELIARASEGPGTFRCLDYASFAASPARLGRGYDVAVCNFSLLGREIGSVLRACAGALAPGGALVVQTVHPFLDAAEGRYEDGWRREDFGAMAAGFRASMPWYFRTLGAWVSELAGAGFRIEALREPSHPETGRPLSLILIGIGGPERSGG